jgi:hypothetical protein
MAPLWVNPLQATSGNACDTAYNHDRIRSAPSLDFTAFVRLPGSPPSLTGP